MNKIDANYYYQLLSDEAIMIQSSIKTTFPIILNRPRIGKSESVVENIFNAAVSEVRFSEGSVFEKC